MSTTKRTDCHRPSVLVPADYVHVLHYAAAGSEDGFPVPAINVDSVLALQAIRPFFGARGLFSCAICGAHFRFGSVLAHVPSGEHLCVGWECAEKVEATGDQSAFLREVGDAKRASMRQIENERKAAERAEFLAANPDLVEALQVDHYISRDLADKLARFGALSEGQIALAFKLQREAAERAAEANAPKVEVPQIEGRVQVEGKVLGLKTVEGFRGATVKMLVQVETPAGSYKVFGTVPSSLSTADLKGKQVRFAASIERSDRDPFFGFFSRPSKAEVI